MQPEAPSAGPLVGFLDSGLGGLSVWWEAVRILPGIRTLYFADRAHCPYGPRPPEEVRKLVEEGVHRLQDAGCAAVVLACNTATAAAVDSLRTAQPDYPFIGMEPAVKPAALHSKTGVVGVLATSGTFHGRLFQGTSARYAQHTRLVARAADNLVPFVERGELDSPALRTALAAHLAPMLDAGVDHIVLGCTHFPFLGPVLQEMAGPSVLLVNPATAVARQLARVLTLPPAKAEQEPLPPPAVILQQFAKGTAHRFLG